MNLLMEKIKTGADFRPFRAWRYNPEKAEIGGVIAPPYDVISSQEQEELYRRSPYNCVRLILNREEPQDGETSNRYLRAGNFFEQWKTDGILIRETRPCFYLYRQVFKHPETGNLLERSSLLGRLKLEPFDARIVIPHEKTLSQPRADRRKLLETTRTNFSPVFGLYEFSHGQEEAIREKVLSTPPLFEALDAQKVRHFLWPIQDREIQEGISEAFSRQKIYIADGHHRYQTALEYGIERRKALQVPEDTELDSDFVLAALVEFQDPGLVLLPTHRRVLSFPGFDEAKALEALKPFFKVEPMPFVKIWEELQSPRDSGTVQIGLYFGPQRSYLLTLTDFSKAASKMPRGRAEVWYRLDVTLISHLILAGLWHLEEPEREQALRYSHSKEETLRAVQDGKAAAAFFLRGPRVEALREMGKHQELMPQKSTFFYPKLASGLVFHQHEK